MTSTFFTGLGRKGNDFWQTFRKFHWIGVDQGFKRLSLKQLNYFCFTKYLIPRKKSCWWKEEKNNKLICVKTRKVRKLRNTVLSDLGGK